MLILTTTFLAFLLHLTADTPAQPNATVPICDYPAPLPGCWYVPGPDYDPTTMCGLVMQCDQPVTAPVPAMSPITLAALVALLAGTGLIALKR
jgi:hypothetical protein